jgi:hypothetical protein
MILSNHGIIQSIKRGGGSIVTDGLVLHLDAGNAASYPGSGTTWTDLSGNGNHATLINGPTFDSANGGSIVYDGSNDYAQVSSTSFTMGTSAYSIGGWIKASTLNTSYSILITIGTGEISRQFYTGRVAGAQFGTSNSLGGGGYAQNIGGGIDGNNEWHYVYAVSSGGSPATVSIYIDSVFKVSASFNLDIITNSVLIGAGNDGGTDGTNYFLNGNISTAEVYNRALSAAEIESNYNAIKGRYGL